MADPENSESLPTQPWAGPAPAVGSAAPTPRASPAPSPRTGKWQPPTPEELQPSFPQYEIRSLLGRGGMGAVYLGWQKSLDRLVAIKILPPQVEDTAGSFAERFKREAKAMARFSHPGIVPVFDAGETPEGLLYFVMEYIEGTDLQKMVATQGALSPEQALAITTEICGALAYAHERGVIHRDIKPSNIMIDAGRRVKVADFGLAKVASDDSGALLTHSHVRMGTPDFMAPEALQGMSHVDHRADLYAVGAMLYQMLTGEVARGRFELPSARRPGVDPRFDAIVDHAMQKDPEKRYSSAADIRSDLENIRSQPGLPAGLPPETAKDVGSDAAANSVPKRRRGKLSARLGGCSLTLALAFCVALVALPQLREIKVATVLLPQGHVAFAPPGDSEPPANVDLSAHRSLPPGAADDREMYKPAEAATPAAKAEAFNKKRQDALNAAVTDADELKKKGDRHQSLDAYLRIAKKYPEFRVGKNRLEEMLNELRDRPNPITFEEFQGLRDQITECAQFDILSAMLLIGDSLRTREPQTAIHWFSVAAGKGNPIGLVNYGQMLKKGLGVDRPDQATAASLFQKAADQGDIAGKYELAVCYLNGHGVTADQKHAVELYLEAAYGGDSRAMVELGFCYSQGLGVAKNPNTAFQWFSKGDEKGNLEATANLGVLYMIGTGVAKDPKKGAQLFEKGAHSGNADCMQLYAAALESGLGVPANQTLATTWYKKAAANGNQAAIVWCNKNKIPFDPGH